jgi:hypothetical protein
MDRSALARWRMRTQRVWGRSDATPAGVLGHLVASQGQDFLPGKWSLAQRCGVPVTDAEMDRAFDAGELLRTHVLRPTWHFVAPGDLRWLLTATTPRVHQASRFQYRALGVEEETVRTLRATLERLLPGRSATRAEVGAWLSEAGLAAEGPRLAYLLMYAELEAWVVSGPLRGRQQTYMLLDERVPGTDDHTREEALQKLALRYFTSRGPATVKDLTRWASLTLAEARSAVAGVGSALESLELDGRTYLVADRAVPPDDRAPEAVSVDLLQPYDELVMSYSESRDVLTGGGHVVWSSTTGRGEVLTGRAGSGAGASTSAGDEQPPPAFYNAIVADGGLVGHWRYERDGSGRPAEVQTWCYRPLDAEADSALDVAVDRFAGFVGAPVARTDHGPVRA